MKGTINRKFRQNKIILAMLLVMYSTLNFCYGCGTIIHGTTQSLTVTSSPSGALAKVNGNQLVTPTSVTLDRNRNYVVTVEKEGYATGSAAIRRSFSPVTLLGILLDFGIISIPIDFISGGAWKLTPDTIHVSLTTEGGIAPNIPPAEVSPGKKVPTEKEKVKGEERLPGEPPIWR